MTSSVAAPPCLCLAGPTAAGKTAAALAIARALHDERPVEIVSVDSALVYRGLDIGTAKPSAEERAAVPHHLIDILEPTQAYSAARFVADAQHLIAAIVARGRLPLLVGGTMLYFKALFDGLDAMPAADPAVRAEIDARAAQVGWPALHAELARVDPITAARLAPGDSQRIQRALEVWQITGQPLASFHRSGPSTPDRSAARPALISLEPHERAWLHERIDARFDQMLNAGLIAEVRRLRARGDLHAELPAMRCVGYRQAWQALEAGLAEPALTDTVRATGSAATRQLAKRQLTWLRSMPHRHVVACDRDDATAAVVAAARRLMPAI
ncbi:MAG TPA: tRNA (adenosine(37)-N6)-dimethylallyltransferase MiaA [Burkholderiaceae bacterium]|nr:tRNA (adenosine(37)-N6)-dimethylallyltransferase MiaA [Burkholderiaceae bacterium]